MTQYSRLHNTLKMQIQKGLYREGEQLPSEQELCTTYQLARSTVRQALSHLVLEGYIKKVQGKGSIISSPVRSLGLLSVTGFSDAMKKVNRPIRTEFVREPAIEEWNEHFYYELTQKEKKAGCITLERLRFTDNHPVMWEFT